MLLKGIAALIMGSAQGLGLVFAKASYLASETIYIDGVRPDLNYVSNSNIIHMRII